MISFSLNYFKLTANVNANLHSENHGQPMCSSFFKYIKNLLLFFCCQQQLYSLKLIFFSKELTKQQREAFRAMVFYNKRGLTFKESHDNL